MKLSQYITAIALVSAAAITSCNKDGNLLYITDTKTAALSGDGDEIVLKYENIDNLALSVYWTDNGQITLSNPKVEAPKNAFENTLQMSATEDFANPLSFVMDKGVLYKQFTVGELNSAVMRLGFEGDQRHELYIRLSSSLGKNVDPRYSNVMKVFVTPYKIYLNYGYVLDSSWNDTGRTLYSAEENGIYEGFLGVSAWYNWYLQEANGVTWGNIGDDGGGKPFVISSNDQKWNYWYPGQSGCYYTIVNTQIAEWSALYIPSITISGDLNGEMTYNQKTNAWYYTFDAKPGTINVSLSGVGKQYNAATGTDDAAAIDTPFGFSGDASDLTFGDTATPISINVTTSGEATITLDLSNPSEWTIVAGEGGGDIPEASPYIWIPGIDDGISGAWTFDNYLVLYNEDQLGYGGACNINSLWGYYYVPEPAWVEGYGFSSGDAYSGELIKDTSTNIPAPEPGIYVIDVSLSAMTYKLTAISSVSYAGLNDDWTPRPMTQMKGCKYKAVVEKSAITPWGVKILINDSWELFFGGGSGELKMYADGFDGDNDLPNGTYTLVVDLAKGTYEYVMGELPDDPDPEDPDEYPDYIYMPGVDDGISGSWTFDNYLVKYDASKGKFGGMANVNTLWGYYYTLQADWGKGYSMDSGDAYSGTLVNNISNNITPPTPGQYVFDVSLSDLTYNLTVVSSVSYTGLNDDWSLSPMTCTDGCIYEATVTKSANTPWGVKIIINENWDLCFGGGSGVLKLHAEGFDGDNDLPNGTYTLQVDLAKATYKYVAQ